MAAKQLSARIRYPGPSKIRSRSLKRPSTPCERWPKIQEATAAHLRTRDQEAIPDAVVGRLLDGENPVRVWREYRGLSLRSLAERAGISASAFE